MMDPVDEYSIQQLKEFGCMKDPKCYKYVFLSITVLLLMIEFSLILKAAQRPELQRASGDSLRHRGDDRIRIRR